MRWRIIRSRTCIPAYPDANTNLRLVLTLILILPLSALLASPATATIQYRRAINAVESSARVGARATG
jgi:hypothetical protein